MILQASYGTNTEPSIYSQINDANAHHIPWGAYTFLEPGVSGSAEAQHALAVTNGRGRTLGIWADAEVSGTYSQACSYTAEAHALGVNVTGVYSAPGLWPGGRCYGYLWAAEWGTGAYAFGGYPGSAVILHQYCGTCFRYGVETDLDSDMGLLNFVHPPKPPPSRHQRELNLDAHERLLGQLRLQIIHLRIKLRHYGCYRHPQAGGHCRGWRLAGARVHQHGRVENSIIAKYHREGVR